MESRHACTTSRYAIVSTILTCYEYITFPILSRQHARRPAMHDPSALSRMLARPMPREHCPSAAAHMHARMTVPTDLPPPRARCAQSTITRHAHAYTSSARGRQTPPCRLSCCSSCTQHRTYGAPLPTGRSATEVAIERLHTACTHKARQRGRRRHAHWWKHARSTRPHGLL